MKKTVSTIALMLVLSGPVFADHLTDSFNYCTRRVNGVYAALGSCMQAYQQAVTNKKLDKLIQVLSDKQNTKVKRSVK